MKWWELRGTIRKGGLATRGYVKVNRKPYRDWYLHRAVLDLLIKEWNFYGWAEIPKDMEVHHINHKREDCKPWNLVLLDSTLHHAIQKEAPRHPYTGRYLDMREWLEMKREMELEEVPF